MAIVWQDVVCGGHPVATFWRACGRLVVCGLPIAALAGIALRAPVCDVFLPLWVDCCVCCGSLVRALGVAPSGHGAPTVCGGASLCPSALLWHSMARHGPPWRPMASPWRRLVSFGIVWRLFAICGPLWASVAPPWRVLVSVEQLGLRSSICRQPLGVAGLLLYPLVFFCPSWISIRLRFGPFWNFWCLVAFRLPPFAFTCDFCAPAWRASVYVMLLCVHLFVLFASPGFGWKSFGASMVMFGLAWRWFGHAWARLASFGSSRFTFGPLELIGHVCVVPCCTVLGHLGFLW